MKRDGVHTEQVKHELRGKLARQATRAQEQLALKLARLMSMIQTQTSKQNPKKNHPTDQLIREVKRKWDKWDEFRAKAGPHSKANASSEALGHSLKLN